MASLLLVLASVFALVAAQCAQSTNPCFFPSCPGSFLIQKIQTDASAKTTMISINVTNNSPNSVFYVQFAISEPTKPMQLLPYNVPMNYQGLHQWNPSIVNGLNSNPPVVWLRFSPATGKYPGTPPQNNLMVNGRSEIFTFTVQNYWPTFIHHWQLHQGDQYETVSQADASLCQCTDCDAAFSQRTTQPCVLGYYNKDTKQYEGPTNRATSIFNENIILYSYGIFNNYLALFYSDEFPMNLGIATVSDTVSVGGGVKNYPISVSKETPTCIYSPNIKFGSTTFDATNPAANIDSNGPANGCKEPNPVDAKTSCGRPVPPMLFITDLTTSKDSRIGDWQFGGDPFFPHKICGIWTNSSKSILTRTTQGTYTFDVQPRQWDRQRQFINRNPPGAGSHWNLGVGSDTPPVGFINPSAVDGVPFIEDYGVEVAWDLDKLGLIPQHDYRFQFIVHDGDDTKVGGDVGQACLITRMLCPAGFSGEGCSGCDANPLPSNNQWTWFCSATGMTEPPYLLQKIPKTKLPAFLAANPDSFVPTEDKIDRQGYAVNCACRRTVLPCEKNCCGNGRCNANNGTCTCFSQQVNHTDCCPTPIIPVPVPVPRPTPNPMTPSSPTPTGMTPSAPSTPTPNTPSSPTPSPPKAPITPRAPRVPLPTQPTTVIPSAPAPPGAPSAPKAPTPPPKFRVPVPPPPVTPPCFNQGKYCSGNGICKDGKCVCFQNTDGSPLFTGVACDSTVVPTCQSFNASNCSTCIITGKARSMACVWCPNTSDTTMYGTGTCTEDFKCPRSPVYTCLPPPVVEVPECPDNCTSNGICINASLCPQLEGKTFSDGQTYSCAASVNHTINGTYNNTNDTFVCACIPGHYGLNCALVASDSLAPILAAGIIAAIVVLGLLGLALCAGGTAAAATGFAAANSTSVMNNPIYTPAGTEASNPIYGNPA